MSQDDSRRGATGRRHALRTSAATLVDRLEPRVFLSASVAPGGVPWMTGSAAAVQAAASQAVASLTLINADTDQPIAGYTALASGTVLDLAALPTRNLNVRANTSPATVGSVRFALDANTNYRTENTAPFALAADHNGDYYAWTPAVGSHTLKATPYTGGNATGTAGAPLTVSFQVVNSGQALPVVGVAATDAAATETAGNTGTFTVTRTGPTTAALTVQLALGGTATNGTDYTQIPATVTIPAGSASATVTIKPIDDAVYEGSEAATLTLQSGGGYTINPSATAATVTIADNETAPAQGAYPGVVPTLPATLEAENFDTGGEGVAYHDTDAANTTGAYRTNVGVDIEPAADAGGGFAVGHVRAGEWLEYTVDVPAAGSYDLGVRFASDSGGGTAHVEIDGADVTGPMTLPNTAGWQVWQTIRAYGVSLPAGRHVLRLAFDSNAWGGDIGNVNWVDVRPATPVGANVSWATAAKAPIAHEESEGASVGGLLYVFGGLYSGQYLATNRVDVYNPATNAWSTRRPMPEALTHSPTVVDGNTVWFIGGYVGNHPGPGTTHVWKYNTTSDTWSRGPDLPVACGAGAAGMIGRTLYYFGGKNETRTGEEDVHFALNIDDPTANWVAKANLPVGRDHISGAAVGGYLYAIGGEIGPDEAASNQSEVDRYDPATDTWTRVADLPAPRSHTNAATFVLNGKIWCVGGEIAHNAPANTVWSYDPAVNKWSRHTNLPNPRRAMVALPVNGKIVATGGWVNGVQTDQTWVGTIL